MLSSCDRAGDVRRAEEWTRVVDELVLDRIGGPRILHTHCQVAYGSVLLGAGRWSEAEAAIQGALGPEGSRSSGHRIDANARLAELRLDQGRTDEAAQLVALHPDDVATALPAARLHLLRGEHDLAVATIARARRALVGDTLRNTPLLALAVEVALADGDVGGAEQAARQLSELADHSEGPVVRAEAEFARGRVQAARRRARRSHGCPGGGRAGARRRATTAPRRARCGSSCAEVLAAERRHALGRPRGAGGVHRARRGSAPSGAPTAPRP